MILPDRSAEALHGTAPRTPLDWAGSLREADMPTVVARALAQGRARLAFQPVVAARGPGAVAFHEGLIRIVDETGTVVPAGAFIAGIEDTALGRWAPGEPGKLGA